MKFNELIEQYMSEAMQEYEIIVDGSTGESFIAPFKSREEAEKYAKDTYGITNWEMIKPVKKKKATNESIG